MTHAEIITASPVTIAPANIAGVTGRLVFFRRNGDTPIEDFDAAVEAHFGSGAPLPRKPSHKVALRRTAKTLATGSKYDTHAHPKGGYAVVQKSETEEAELDFATNIRIYLDGDLLMVETPHHHGPARDDLRASYEHARTTYTADDFSAFLPRLFVEILGGVSLRDGGGFYFIPASAVGELDRWMALIHQATDHRIFGDIPALETDDLLEGVLEAITHEAQQGLKDAQVPAEGGKRALKNAGKRLEAITAKLARYEEILGRSLPQLTQATDAAKAETAGRLLLAEER